MSIGKVWQFLTPPSQMGRPGRHVVDARGVHVRFADGVSAVCGTSGLWNVNFGYGNPTIAAAIQRELAGLHYAPLFRYSHESALGAAEELLAVPALARFASVLYGTSGSATLDMVLKLARHWCVLGGEPARRIVVSARGSYHGMTYGALSLTGEDLGQALYGVDQRAVRHVAVDSGAELLELAGVAGDRLAAIVLEPVAGTGARPLAADFLAAAAQVRDTTGALLVADEVATGYHRTGPFLASDTWPAPPDVVVLSKGLTNGYCAASVAMVGRRVVERFDAADAVLGHGETQAGCPVSCAAIRGTLRYVAQELDRERVDRQATLLHEHLDDLCDEFGLTHHGRGSFRGLDLRELVVDLPGLIPEVIERTRRNGGVVHPYPHGVQLVPQLVTPPAELHRLVEALRTGLRQALGSARADTTEHALSR